MTYYEQLSKSDLYEQLAEEATELAKACLKMARRLRGTNPTPLSEEEISKMITEEFTDVLNVAYVLHLESDPEIAHTKLSRWDNRLRAAMFNDGSWPKHPLLRFNTPIKQF